MVYYRKYRPQLISELDLDSVREKLTAILSSKDLPHAFLFTGSKGLGKTSAARILAKAINCELRVTGIKDQNILSQIEPCGECQACVSITNGSNIDVLEIDAASNGGVEEIRTLRERVKFAPSMLRKKVYIIDEVHMLSTGAFNALLKTLEEPPSHVVFILATTELWKLPPTVVSRTFQVQFEKPTGQQMSRSLERIVKGEGLSIKKGILERISEMSDGAFRDAAKNLEELALASRGKEITEAIFDEVFKTKGLEEEVFLLLKAYQKRNTKLALESIARISENGVDYKIVFERIVDHLRGLLMIRNQIPSSERDVEGLSIQDIEELLSLANEAYGELRTSIIPQLPLELMSVKFCVINNEIQEAKTQSSKNIVRPSVESTTQSAPTTGSSPLKPPLTSKENFLPQLIDELNKTNKPGAALLRSCKDAVVEEEKLVIATPFPIHADRLRSDKVFSDLQVAVEKLFEKKLEVQIKVLPN